MNGAPARSVGLNILRTIMLTVVTITILANSQVESSVIVIAETSVRSPRK